MIEEATEDLVKGDAIFNCLVFSCLSICNSLGGAVTVVISFFQPYTQGPSHVFKGGVMTTYTKIFSFNGALVLMIPSDLFICVDAIELHECSFPCLPAVHHTSQM